jgi:photosystem II stability/assembly factor-like uncharacterized protein
VYAPLDPDLALAGTASGQVYRSVDGGATWSPAGAPLPFPGWVVGTLLFDPDRPQRLWAGLRGVYGGGMVAWSEDHGAHWTVPHDVAAFGDRPVYALAIGGGRLFAGTRAGVLRSADDGASWILAGAGTRGLINVHSLWIEPGRPGTVLAGTWRRAYRSTDGGATWRGVFDGMVEDTDVFSLHAVAGRPGALWASTCGWVYSTRDRGATWTRHRDGLAERRTPSFAVLSDQRLLAGTVAGAYLSSDGGQAWERVSPSDLSVSAIAHHPARPGRVLLGTEGAGVWRSDDGGRDFRPVSEGLRNVRVAAAAQRGGTAWVAVNHAGPASGLYRSEDGGRSFERAIGGLPTVIELAASRDALFAATEAGLFEILAAGPAAPVAEIGPRRIDQVEVGHGREPGSDVVAARAGGEVWVRRGGRFERAATGHGAIASIALAGGSLWASDSRGLSHLASDGWQASATPEKNGHLEPAGRGLALNGGASLWLRSNLSEPWQEVATGHPRVIATHDPRWPLVVVSRDASPRLAESSGSGLVWRALDLPVPGEDLLAALVVGDRLLLATSGHGVIAGSLR